MTHRVVHQVTAGEDVEVDIVAVEILDPGKGRCFCLNVGGDPREQILCAGLAEDPVRDFRR